jgi:hypothetical protein
MGKYSLWATASFGRTCIASAPTFSGQLVFLVGHFEIFGGNFSQLGRAVTKLEN